MMQNTNAASGRPPFPSPGNSMRFNSPTYPRPAFNQIQNSPSNASSPNPGMIVQRPNMIGNPTSTNAYTGQPVRPGGPGMSPQTVGPGKRPGDMRAPNQAGKMEYGPNNAKKKKKLADKILPQKEALKRPMKQKRKLRIFISNTFYPAREVDTPDDVAGGSGVASWELRVEGRLLDDAAKSDPNKVKRKFSSFFKSLVIELDKDLYGPDNHLVEWHRTSTTQETDGFQVKRPGDRNVRCTILLLLDYQPLQFRLDSRLARLLGIHTQTRPMVISALWQYIKTHRLQDHQEREFIRCDKYMEQIFGCPRMKFAEIPQRLNPLLHPPDPIVINHLISSVESADQKKTACYDIDVEVDDTLKAQMNNFLLSTASQQEIQVRPFKFVRNYF
ncbi:SWI/SNF-related matrix-associated actin-dependent regulator of chromatin subfamily D member [Daphnia magna]|uniref:SWI/SNF-related matrix-associated actin-dependent regulator of chromatin subfamily D member n=1 Tax=Daphnia magna TaxID=35525 RepID=A0A164I4G8_9CRUS|nr:SWI/SNF-related matrix-associated actin-dependent regulator of chromatin subfamily D member [Daphnia magna]